MNNLVIKGLEVINSRSFQVCTGLGAALGLTGVAGATDSAATFPSTGIDVAATITASVAALGATVAVAVGAYFSWKILKKGISWVGRALG